MVEDVLGMDEVGGDRTEISLRKREMVKPMASRRRYLMARLKTWHPRR